MKVWIVRDGYGSIVDIFNSAEGAYSYLFSEVKRWADEYPEEVTPSDEEHFTRQLVNEYQNYPDKFSTGNRSTEFYLWVVAFDVRS